MHTQDEESFDEIKAEWRNLYRDPRAWFQEVQKQAQEAKKLRTERDEARQLARRLYLANIAAREAIRLTGMHLANTYNKDPSRWRESVPAALLGAYDSLNLALEAVGEIETRGEEMKEIKRKPFKMAASCPKCGHVASVRREYHSGKEEEGQDYLKVTCLCCGYSWEENCLDFDRQRKFMQKG